MLLPEDSGCCLCYTALFLRSPICVPGKAADRDKQRLELPWAALASLDLFD